MARRVSREIPGLDGGAGCRRLQGRAFETGGRLPYQPLVDALRSRLERETRRTTPERRLGCRAGPAPAELRDRYPAYRSRLDEVAAAHALFRGHCPLGQALAQRAPVGPVHR